MIRVEEPATERLLAELPDAGAAEIDLAVSKARAALSAWRPLSARDRGRLLRRMASVIDVRREQLATLEARDVGKTIADARAEIDMVVETFEYFSGAPERLLGETIPVSGGADFTFREPLGVVGLITPWNYPLTIASWKVAPALAAGNTVVLKAPVLAPMTSLELEGIADDAGIPSGVVNVVAGRGDICGARLVDHPDVAKIAFTGSTEVGRGIAARAAATVKRVTLELGGKSANIVFADADLDAAAAAAPGAIFANAGQDCCARSRILVERAVFDRFEALLAESVDALVVGDPLDEGSQMGPLVSAERRRAVAEFVEGDAPVAMRGRAPASPGHWFPPTVVGPVSNSVRVAREEVFGPVACLIPFSGESEAAEIANDTRYGLSGSIWTSNGARALRVARALATGTVSINSNTSVRVATPFGGFKESGLGRELGPRALEHYTEVKNVFFSTERLGE